MKFKATKKEIMNGFYTVAVSYCGLQHLFQYDSPAAYTCGVYGWNADVYTFGNIAIVTGYRPFGSHIDYDIVNGYEKRAEAIVYDRELPFTEKVERVQALRDDFIQYCRKNII